MLSKNITLIKINLYYLLLAYLTLFLQSCGKGISQLESLSQTNPFNNSNGPSSAPTNTTVTEILPPSSTTGGLISLFYQSLVAPLTFPTPTFGSFYFPSTAIRDSSGNIYVADSLNRLIRKISPTGEVTSVAGNGGGGCTNGLATSADLYLTGGIAMDSSENIYIGEQNGIRKITPAGVISSYAGICAVGGSIVDGNTSTARFQNMNAYLAIDSAGNTGLIQVRKS